MTVQNLEEKAELNEAIERLKGQFAAVSNNLEVQTADNSQLSRYKHTHITWSVLVYHLPSVALLAALNKYRKPHKFNNYCDLDTSVC